MGIRIGAKVFGCKVNQSEAAYLMEKADDLQWILDKNQGNCNVFWIKTCAVTARSEQKVCQYIRRLCRENGSAPILVSGCACVRDSCQFSRISESVKTFKDDQAVIEWVRTNRKYIQQNNCEPEDGSGKECSERTRFFLKIQDGCNRFCSYCIVPYVRPRITYLERTDVYSRIEAKIREGFREVVLCGINLALYPSLPGLIRKISLIKGIERIRLSSLEPAEISVNAIIEIFSVERVCPHLHFPLQSGDDNVLRDMGRRYTAAQYADSVETVRSRIPGIAVTTDVITGYPTESEEAFMRTYEFCRNMNFNKIHVFRYSPRLKTASFLLQPLASPQVKKRAGKLLMLEKTLRLKHQKRTVDSIVEILVERKRSSRIYGYTPDYKRVMCVHSDASVSDIVPVKVCGVKGGMLKGIPRI